MMQIEKREEEKIDNFRRKNEIKIKIWFITRWKRIVEEKKKENKVKESLDKKLFIH